MDALRDKYTVVSAEDLSTEKQRKFGDSGVTVEMVGFEKAYKKQRYFYQGS